MLTCQELTELANDYIEEDISWWNGMQVRVHLWMCEHCQQYVHQLKQTVELTRSVEPEPLSDRDHAALRSVYQQWKTESR